MRSAADILIVVIDSTTGWRSGAAELAASLRRGGASVRVESTGPVPRVRTFALTDFSQAWLARRAAQRGIASPLAGGGHLLLGDRRAAVAGAGGDLPRLDRGREPARPPRALAAAGRAAAACAGAAAADLERAFARPRSAAAHAPALLVPPPVDPFAAESSNPVRDIDVITYAGDPEKRRLTFVLEAWARARRDEETLVVAGLDGFGRPPASARSARSPRPEFRAAAAPRACVRRGAAARGLRDRRAGGARRGLPCS